MEKESMVYLTAMQDSLRSKREILEKIFAITRRQEEIISQTAPDMERFEETLDAKAQLISQMQELDAGFQSVYDKMKTDIEKNKQEYRPRILEMQNLIRQMTELGVKIQALEQKNKQKFENFTSRKKQEIQEFYTNSRTVGVYAQHMANQHQEWQSYFVDKKK